MRTMFRAVLGLSLVALVASPVAAQGQGRGSGMFMGGALGALIGNSGVQKELKLDDTQVEKAKELATKTREQMREHFQDLQGLEGAERRTKQQEFNKEMRESSTKALGEFLKPDQIHRLKQISYHLRGPGVLLEAEVAHKLELSADQKKEVRTILQEMVEHATKIREEHRGDPETIMKKSNEARKESMQKAVTKLNDEQQKTWKEILGAPFELKPDA
jgi:hypothetical protein